MQNLDWEDFFLILLYCVICFIVYCFARVITADDKVKEYRLDQGLSGNLYIEGVIDWRCNKNIKLAPNISYTEAIRLIDTLNSRIKKP